MTAQLKKATVRRALAVAMAPLLALVALAGLDRPATAGPDRSADKRTKSGLLRTAAEPGEHPWHKSADASREAARQYAAQVPLPEGGNFNGIRWEDAPTLTQRDVVFTLQYNAACQWYRAVADGREVGVGRSIADDIEQWSAFRGFGESQRAAAVADAIDGTGPAYREALEECRASHQREVAYARQRGTTPSS